jgi:hypothetical protein
MQYLMSEVDPVQATFPLASYCFMTGFIDAVTFSAIFVWCGFQTGNFIQLGLALARLFDGPRGKRDHTFHRADQQALTSLVTFNAGASLGRIGDKMGYATRLWLFLGTFIQALLTMAGAISIYKAHQPSVAAARDEPSWTDARTYVGLGFLSASLGLQGIMAKRLNTQFATTVVLTTVWVELMTDPNLFNFRHFVVSRDHKIIAASTLFIGGFCGRALTQSIGAGGTLGIGVGFRVIIAISWLFVPGKRTSAAVKN